MKIHLTSLAFGYQTLTPGNTPSWETPLGQGTGHRINQDDSINEILKGMVYCSVPTTKVSIKLRSGIVSGAQEGNPLVSAAVFNRVYINDTLIENGKYILIITRDHSPSHYGRLMLKYGKSNTYTENGAAYSNDDFFTQAKAQLGLANDACFFVSEIDVVNQDKLVLKTHFINKEHSVTYADRTALRNAWSSVTDFTVELPDDEEEQTQSKYVIANSIPADLSIEDLGHILADMYANASVGNQSNAIRMFGIKYGGLIAEKGFSATAITKASGIDTTSYSSEVSKGISIYKSIKDNEYGIRFYEEEESSPIEVPSATAFDFNAVKGTAVNKIFFGTPGCGKSYHIEHNLLGKNPNTKMYAGDYQKENIVRTTFYQDYSNTDFVGQILPKIEKDEKSGKETVRYIFNPGPFTLALIQAISHPTEKVALVIEEINRGNAPAIFGDIFQLLDRDEHSISEYGIVNVGLMDYLNSYEFKVSGEKKRYTFSEIKIPGNLDIFATMNTSDQNVYTLDTAFVRRWDREKIKNSFAKCNFKATKIPGMDYTWQEFVEAINTCIASHLEDLQVNEDKQIGAFFVKESLLSGSAEKFAYKVFDYLWNDVAKLDHGIFFNHYDTLDALIAAYVEKGVAVFKPGIFKEKVATPVQSEATDE